MGRLDADTRRRLEGLFWLAGLVAVAMADPTGDGLLSLCPFDALGSRAGLDFCPGCGLGHAVGFLVRGRLVESFQAHPLALPVFVGLIIHAAGLLKARQAY